MKNTPKEINNVSTITEKKEAVKIMKVEKGDISMDKTKSKNSRNFEKFRRYRKHLWNIESIIAKSIFSVVILVIILVVKSGLLSTTKSVLKSENSYKPISIYKKRFFKRKLLSCPAGYFLSGRT